MEVKKQNWVFWVPALSHSMLSEIQLDPANLNSPLFRAKTHFPWTCPSVIHYRLFQTRAISNYFSSGVQLYSLKSKSHIDFPGPSPFLFLFLFCTLLFRHVLLKCLSKPVICRAVESKSHWHFCFR